jgi:hypothetical protein
VALLTMEAKLADVLTSRALADVPPQLLRGLPARRKALRRPSSDLCRILAVLFERAADVLAGQRYPPGMPAMVLRALYLVANGTAPTGRDAIRPAARRAAEALGRVQLRDVERGIALRMWLAWAGDDPRVVSPTTLHKVGAAMCRDLRGGDGVMFTGFRGYLRVRGLTRRIA